MYIRVSKQFILKFHILNCNITCKYSALYDTTLFIPVWFSWRIKNLDLCLVGRQVIRLRRHSYQLLKADFHSAENIARSTFSAHFLLNCSNQIQISEHISKESEREKSIARHFPLNVNPPLSRFSTSDFFRAKRLFSFV